MSWLICRIFLTAKLLKMDDENVNNIQLSPPKKTPKKHFSVEVKQIIMNAFKVCEEQNPQWKKHEKVENVARLIGHVLIYLPIPLLIYYNFMNWSGQCLQHTS